MGNSSSRKEDRFFHEVNVDSNWVIRDILDPCLRTFDDNDFEDMLYELHQDFPKSYPEGYTDLKTFSHLSRHYPVEKPQRMRWKKFNRKSALRRTASIVEDEYCRDDAMSCLDLALELSLSFGESTTVDTPPDGEEDQWARMIVELVRNEVDDEHISPLAEVSDLIRELGMPDSDEYESVTAPVPVPVIPKPQQLVNEEEEEERVREVGVHRVGGAQTDQPLRSEVDENIGDKSDSEEVMHAVSRSNEEVDALKNHMKDHTEECVQEKEKQQGDLIGDVEKGHPSLSSHEDVEGVEDSVAVVGSIKEDKDRDASGEDEQDTVNVNGQAGAATDLHILDETKDNETVNHIKSEDMTDEDDNNHAVNTVITDTVTGTGAGAGTVSKTERDIVATKTTLKKVVRTEIKKVEQEDDKEEEEVLTEEQERHRARLLLEKRKSRRTTATVRGLGSQGPKRGSVAPMGTVARMMEQFGEEWLLDEEEGKSDDEE